MFEDLLSTIVNKTPGALGAAVINLDGLTVEAVDAYGHPAAADTAASDYASVFKQLAGLRDSLDVGDLQEFTVSGTGRTILVRMLTSTYYAALAIAPDGLLGKGRYQLRIASPDLAREL